MSTDLNIQPYYDDFNASNGFHQILFKPGTAVQARELTQIQSMLRDQIAKFGSHVFKHGSVVLPGNSSSDLNVCYVKLANTTVDPSTLVGRVAVGTSGLRGLIRAGVAQGSEPAKLYVSYYNTGNGGEAVFGENEVLTITGASSQITLTTSSSNATGAASMAMINEGVFFVNGSFVEVLKQSVVIGDTATPSCHVLLKIDETIVTADADTSLLDPAQGTNNYAAPGADRLKIKLTLVTLPLGTTFGNDYIEIMRFDNGELLEHLRYAQYNELEKSLARRTFDESGNYVVSGNEVLPKEHLKSELNGGKFLAADGGDASKMIYRVTAGKAYVSGFEVEKIAPVDLVVDKARTTNTITANIVPSYGKYLYVSNLVSLPNFANRETLTLYNAASGGSVIGTATAIAIDFEETNSTNNNQIYKLFLSSITINTGSSIADIGRVTFSSGAANVLQKFVVSKTTNSNFAIDEIVTSGTRNATVHKFSEPEGVLYVRKHSTSQTPVTGDTLSAPSTASAKVSSIDALGRNALDTTLIELPSTSTYRVKNDLNLSDITYKIYYQTTVNIVGGAGSFSVTGMTIDPKEVGNFIITSAAGVHPLSAASVASDGLSVTFSGISPASTTLNVVCAATKIGSNGAPKTKTLVSSFSQSGLAAATQVQLSMADVIRVRSVVSTVDGDVTNRYRLDGGQRDYAYLRGILELVGTLPAGTLTVTYDYFNHNAGSGDYFSIDSYESAGIANYYDASFYNYVSPNTGKSYDLRDCLDFRPRVGIDGTFTGVGSSTIYTPQIDSRITTSLQQYVGRVDAVAIEKNGTIRTFLGAPSMTPVAPSVDSEMLHIASIHVPPYTFKANDVKVIKQNTRVYTMKDVGALEKRIANIEDLVLLTEVEQSIVNYDVVDANTGLSRFKSGYLVDSFSNPDKISLIDDPKFGVAYVGEKIIPKFEIAHVPLTLVSSTAQMTGNVATLPYTHSILAAQPMSSRVTNINPFSVFSWNGDMTITPSRDEWVEIENLPTNFTSTTEFVTVTRWVQLVAGRANGGWGGGLVGDSNSMN
jgi:hypothetical protein